MANQQSTTSAAERERIARQLLAGLDIGNGTTLNQMLRDAEMAVAEKIVRRKAGGAQ